MKIKQIISLLCFTPLISLGQADSSDLSWKGTPSLSLMGYVDTYYAYDFNSPSTGPRQNFLFNFNRHNEFNINLGLIKLEVEHQKYRAKLGFQTGTYPQDNYAPEQELLRNVHCASVGLSLDKHNKWWLDAGIFSSNLGFESAMSIKNWTLSRSLVAESSPYYLAGSKLSFTPSKKWSYTFLVSNGWQKIRRTPNNSLPSFGSQVVYTPKTNLELNWSTYIGPENTDANREMRYFNNLYAIINKEKKWSWILGLDAGFQENQGIWAAPVFISRLKLNPQNSMTFRAEYFGDAGNIIIQQPFSLQTEIFGFSINYDYRPVENVALRFEARYFEGGDFFSFSNVDGAYANNLCLLASFAIQMDKHWK